MLQKNDGAGAAGREPVFHVPGGVSFLVILLLVIHVAFSFALDEQGKLDVWVWFGYIPARFTEPGIPGGLLPLLWTPFTHAFLHGDWSHVGLNVAWLAIFGTPVARRYGTFRFWVVFLAGVLGGVLLYTVLEYGSPGVLIGASGGIAGLTGASMRFIFQPPVVLKDPLTGDIRGVGQKLASLGETWANRRARTFSLFWLGINLAIPVYEHFVRTQGAGIAWQAHVGGFVAGLFMPDLIEYLLRQSSGGKS